jgi:hypothetical protein
MENEFFFQFSMRAFHGHSNSWGIALRADAQLEERNSNHNDDDDDE